MLQQRLNQLLANNGAAALQGIQRGIEKEALRITPQGKLAQTPHPTLLGSALTHPCITTDFSESLLEFITPPCNSVKEALQYLGNIHRHTYHQLHNNKSNEMLWVASMPCILEGSDNIPLASYGTSNIAKMKYAYRMGLSHRYGKAMQTIAGIHYNFSLPDEFWQILKFQEKATDSLQNFKTRRYLDLIRNYRRYFWLLLYLFGAAPAVCKTFAKDINHKLHNFSNHSLYYPYATSLRMGNLGYQSESQASLKINYNSLPEYLDSLLHGLTTLSPEYEKIGVCENDAYKQLNANILQIENEFYSTIRPKRVAHSNEAPIKALHERGIEYIEVRSVDVNPFNPVGIDAEQACFIENFLLFCLLSDSPPCSEEEEKQLYWNQHQVVENGRDPQQQVYCHGSKLKLRDCATKLLKDIEKTAVLLAEMPDASTYQTTLQTQQDKISDANLTPSGQLLQLMEKDDLSFYHFALQQAQQNKNQFLSQEVDISFDKWLQQASEKSLQLQRELEENETKNPKGFAQFLNDYYQQYADIAAKNVILPI